MREIMDTYIEVDESINLHIIANCSQMINDLARVDRYHDKLENVLYRKERSGDYKRNQEFYIVTPWLAKKLDEDYGESVNYDFLGFSIWGTSSIDELSILKEVTK